MYMNYVTQCIDGHERLIAVVSDESSAKRVVEASTYRYGTEKITFHIKGLLHLLRDKVEIPPSMHWLVESDRKHQEREIESRVENLCDLDFPKKVEG